MKDIMIYHPATKKYVCIDSPEIMMWEHEPLSIKKTHDVNNINFVWCYSARMGKNYGNYSAQGIHHKKTGAVLGISGTGETDGEAIAIYNRNTCRDLLLTVRHLNATDCHIIWSRAGLYLAVGHDGNHLTWSSSLMNANSVFQMRIISPDTWNNVYDEKINNRFQGEV